MFSAYKVVAFVLFLVAEASNAPCYVPNGTDTNLIHGTSNEYISCKLTWPGAQHSMCCRTGSGLDRCLPNGLCQNTFGHPGSGIWRESCTDLTWQDPGCLKLYINGTDSDGVLYNSNDRNLQQCDDGSYCTGPQNQTCCELHDGFQLLDNGILLPANVTGTTTMSATSATSLASSIPATSMTTTTASSSSVASTVGAQSNSSDTNPGVITGAVIGGAVLGALLLAGIAILIRQNKNKGRGKSTSDAQRPDASLASLKRPLAGELDSWERERELDSQERLELDSLAMHCELPASGHPPSWFIHIQSSGTHEKMNEKDA